MSKGGDKMQTEKFDLKQIRGFLKLSQENMAEKLDISREHYARLENDSEMLRKCKINIALKLSEISGIDLDSINFFY